MEIVRFISEPCYHRFLIVKEKGPGYYIGDEYMGDISEEYDDADCSYDVRRNVEGYDEYYELSEKEKTIIRFNLIKEFYG